MDDLNKLLGEDTINLAKVNKLLTEQGYGYKLIKKKFKSLERLMNWRKTDGQHVNVKLVQKEGKDVVCYYHQKGF